MCKAAEEMKMTNIWTISPNRFKRCSIAESSILHAVTNPHSVLDCFFPSVLRETSRDEECTSHPKDGANGTFSDSVTIRVVWCSNT